MGTEFPKISKFLIVPLLFLFSNNENDINFPLFSTNKTHHIPVGITGRVGHFHRSVCSDNQEKQKLTLFVSKGQESFLSGLIYILLKWPHPLWEGGWRPHIVCCSNFLGWVHILLLYLDAPVKRSGTWTSHKIWEIEELWYLHKIPDNSDRF